MQPLKDTGPIPNVSNTFEEDNDSENNNSADEIGDLFDAPIEMVDEAID